MAMSTRNGTTSASSVDVVDEQDLRRRHDGGAGERAGKTVEAADQSGGKSLQPDGHHGAGEAGIERDQHAGERSDQSGEAPGERVDGVQVDAALGGEQRVLAGGAD